MHCEGNMQINVVKSTDILKTPSAAAIRQLTTDSSLGTLGVDFMERGKPEKNPRITGETNYNNSTHMSSKFFFYKQHEAIPRWSLDQL